MESTTASALHPLATIPPIVPLSQNGSTTAKQWVCVHQKKKKNVFSNMRETSINLQTCMNVHDGHNNSVSSTAPLMSGGRSLGLFLEGSGLTFPAIEGERGNAIPNECDKRNQVGKTGERFRCWKCFWGRWVARAGKYWAVTSSCLCFVCCGYECDDESTVYGGSPCGSGIGHFVQCTESRRDVLEQTPAFMV